MHAMTILVIRLDCGDGSEYVLYEVPAGRAGEARDAVASAWKAYDASGRAGLAEDAFGAALRSRGIPYGQKPHESVEIKA